LYFPFSSQEKQTDWLAQSGEEKFVKYVKNFHGEGLYPSALHEAYGGMEVTRSGYLDIPVYLDAARNYFTKLGVFIRQQVQPEDIVLSADGVLWAEDRFEKVIFCNGTAHSGNYYTDWLKFKPVKGEVLRIRIQSADFEHIINRNGFLLPVGNNEYKLGATYDNHFRDTLPSGKGREELVQKLVGLLRTPYEVTDHWAGVRPATHDRRPYIGRHPAHEQVLIFNGLGTKGVSLAPYFAAHFADVLADRCALMPEADIRRVWQA
jgi:glycine/D-amino acid oxidase-like deaminating enzyme